MSDSWPYRGTVFTRGQPLPDKDDPDIESRVTPNLHQGVFENLHQAHDLGEKL
jgi:hypothetical protein